MGNVIYDLLTIPTKDEERGVTYPAWTVCNDKNLQISSDTVVNDKIKRTLSTNAEEVIIPIAGTSEINSNMHLTLQANLRAKNILLPMDDYDVEYKIFDNIDGWVLKSSEEKAEMLATFMGTRHMINEAVTLNTEYNNGLVKVKEDRSATKDRYMTLAMFNYFGEKLKNKYLRDDSDEEFDESDFSEIYNY